MNDTQLHNAQLTLGKSVHYSNTYDPSLLFAIKRIHKRQELNLNINNLPFFGVDIWNHYELSWLNNNGKPCVAICSLIYDCSSSNIIESKSMKLYFNSFNNTKFIDIVALLHIIVQDISACIDAPVTIYLYNLDGELITSHGINHCHDYELIACRGLQGQCLDDLDILCDDYNYNKNHLQLDRNSKNYDMIHEVLYSNLLKSNCLITNQPDWGSIQIEYQGIKIDHIGLLKYLISFRNHNEFHEQCIERIFCDIWQQCQPQKLIVFARYTRRGGIDINPYRSSIPINQNISNIRLIRQ